MANANSNREGITLRAKSLPGSFYPGIGTTFGLWGPPLWILASELAVLVTHSGTSSPVVSKVWFWTQHAYTFENCTLHACSIFTYFTFLTSRASCGNIWCFANVAKSSGVSFSKRVLGHVQVALQFEFYSLSAEQHWAISNMHCI